MTRLAAGGIDAVPARLQPRFESPQVAESGTPRSEALVAALNGVMGNRLFAGRNPLAIPMTLR